MAKRGYSKKPVGTCGFGYDKNIVNKFKNTRIDWHWYTLCMLLAMGRFKWKNLPPNVDARLIEESLIFYGSCLFWYNPIMDGYYATPSANTGFDINGIPTNRRVNRWNKFNGSFDSSNSVIIYNDYMRQPFIWEIEYFVDQFVLLDKVKNINTKLQAKPKAIIGSMDNVNSLNQLINNIDNMSVPYIKIDEGILGDIQKAQAVDLGREIILEPLEKQTVAVYNRYLTRLGYNNVNIIKKERLISDEAQANSESIMGIRDTSFQMRKQACEQINKMFNLNVDVEFVSIESLTGKLPDIQNRDIEDEVL